MLVPRVGANFTKFGLEKQRRTVAMTTDSTSGQSVAQRLRHAMPFAPQSYQELIRTAAAEIEGLEKAYAQVVRNRDLDAEKLRDKFAMSALPTIISRPIAPVDRIEKEETHAEFWARLSYIMADAMLEARKPKT
jgi:hypothetical protein